MSIENILQNHSWHHTKSGLILSTFTSIQTRLSMNIDGIFGFDTKTSGRLVWLCDEGLLLIRLNWTTYKEDWTCVRLS